MQTAHQPLNVVLTLASLAARSGGPSRSSTQLAAGLARAGVGVEMVSLDLQRTLGPPILPPVDLVPAHLVPAWHSDRFRCIYSAAFGPRLRACAVSSRAVVIHDNGIWLSTNYTAAKVAGQLGLPLVVSLRGMLEPWSLQHRAWKKRLAWACYQRRVLEGAAVLHATSLAEAESARAVGLRQPIAVIPNGTDTSPTQPAPGSRERLVVFLSRLHPKKGLMDLVRAWGALHPRGWRLVIAGPDENGYRQQVEAAIAREQVATSVSLVGPVEGEAKVRLLQQASWFVLPSYSENFGLVVAEALSAGTPVITTHATPWEELETHRCGRWIPTGHEALTSALREALETPAPLCEQMGAAGRRLIEERYSWSRIADEMKTVYQWLVREGTAPPCVQLLSA